MKIALQEGLFFAEELGVEGLEAALPTSVELVRGVVDSLS